MLRNCFRKHNARNLRERLPACFIGKFDAYTSMLGNDGVNSSLTLYSHELERVHVP